ncbi:hypothetical protein ACO0QE_002277 [Hanseniaspora vineae]
MSKVPNRSTLLQKLLKNARKNTNSKCPDPNYFQVWWNKPKHTTNAEFLPGQKELIEKVVKPQLNTQLGLGNYTVNNYKTMDGVNTWHFASTSNTSPSQKKQPPLVLLHGYLSSSMCYYKNVPGLLNTFSDIYLVDLPGHGATTYRVKELQLKMQQPLPIKPKVTIKFDKSETLENKVRSVQKAEFSYPYLANSTAYQHMIKQSLSAFYVDMLEQWKHDSHLKNTKINLVGHSFGGYLSFQYWLKYGSKSVNKLALVSPLGMERNLFSINNTDIYANEVYPIDFGNPLSSRYCRPTRVPDFLFNNQFKVFDRMGPLGAWILWQYCKGRYAKEDGIFQKELFNQLYNMSAQEQNFNLSIFKMLFSPHLTAYDPVFDYSKYIADQQDRFMCIFGDHDWMNAKSGEFFKNSRLNSNSGHNLMLDNPEAFNRHLETFFVE